MWKVKDYKVIRIFLIYLVLHTSTYFGLPKECSSLGEPKPLVFSLTGHYK